jgi:hypothetical protein
MVQQRQAQPLMALTTMPAGAHIGTQAFAFAGTKPQVPWMVASEELGR